MVRGGVRGPAGRVAAPSRRHRRRGAGAAGALEHGGAYLEAAGQAQLNLQLAEILGARDEVERGRGARPGGRALGRRGGRGPDLGAWARHLLGGFLLRQGRWAEAAEVLESALPDLSAETHGDGAVVQTLWWLGDCLSELGEHRESAEHWLKAAEIARHWPEQQDHAILANLAAESLGHAGLPAEADQAYERAGDLWRDARQRARPGARPARPRVARAAHGGGPRRRPASGWRRRSASARGARAAADDLEARERLGAELAHTHRQFGDLLARSAAEDAEDGAIEAAFEAALAQMAKAIAVFASLGEEGLHGRTGAELAAGWLEADLSRPSEAAARARGVLAAYEGFDDSTRRRAPAGRGGTDAATHGGAGGVTSPPAPRARPAFEDEAPSGPKGGLGAQPPGMGREGRRGRTLLRAPPHSTPISSNAPCRPPRYTTVSTARYPSRTRLSRCAGDALRHLVAEDQGDHLAARREHPVQDGLRGGRRGPRRSRRRRRRSGRGRHRPGRRRPSSTTGVPRRRVRRSGWRRPPRSSRRRPRRSGGPARGRRARRCPGPPSGWG